MTPEKQDRLVIPWLFAALLAISAWGTSVGWNHGFLPGNEFRQTHTAISALFIQRENNFSLAYPTPLLGRPWSIPYEFPLYQWTVVRLSNATGLGLTQSARAVSWTCFYLALPAVWLLLGHLGVARLHRLIILGVVLTCPIYIFYARAFLIETMALMFSLWFLAAYVSAVRDRHLGWLALANVAGAGAGLVKVTTYLLYLLPAAIWSAAWLWRAWRSPGPAADRGRSMARAVGWMAAATAAPFAVTLWWIHFADRVKALNLSGRFLMSDAMNGYHFGNWQLRRSPELWKIFWHTLVTNIAPALTLGVFAVAAVAFGGRWRRWILGCVLLFATAPVVFPNLYSWHEYYFSANSVLLMAAIGLTLCALLDSRLPRWFVWPVILGLYATQLWTYRLNLYPGQALALGGGSGLTRLLRDATGPDDVLLIAGDDWAPMIPFYAQRRALMFRRGMDRDGDYIPKAFATLKSEKVSVLILRHESRENDALCRAAHACFGLELEPVATWEDARIFVRPSLRPALVKQFHSSPYGDVMLVGQAAADADAYQFVERATANLPETDRHLFDTFSPRPVRFSSRYALGVITYDNRPILMAHPNSRLWVAPERGLRQVSAEFGILPSAYENVQPPDILPEGVTFSVIRSRPDGSVETIFQRFLDPVAHPSDRGLQELRLSVQLEPGDQLAFVTGPGPQGIYNRTWSYWASAQVK